ncbi:MAG TPA: MFS transporter [Bdellovibrionota bacterium]|nr:MFS transporter [Bdellovibrionota bacterium]
MSSTSERVFTGYQKLVIAVLAFLNFTIILDFMILSPLGAMLMPELGISPAQFGLLVSIYAFSAGTSGILAAGFADRFDRKKLLLFFYFGFLLGTFLCAMATSYVFLLLARMVTGLFGGVIGAIVMAITADLFPMAKRGRVLGFIQTAFAASQILGIPIGLALATRWGWHAPFLLIVGVGLGAGAIIFLKLKPIDTHLTRKTERHAFRHLLETLTTPRYLQAFAATVLLSTGGFMLMPFSSAFCVQNLGIPLEKLPLIYLVTGLATMVAGPLVGRLADSFGKFRTFVFGSVLSAAMVILFTRLESVSVLGLMAVNSILFVGIFSRMIPSQAIMSAVPAPAMRGSFMAINSSTQQISGGIASALAGWLVVEGPGGRIQHFDVVGNVIVGAMALTLIQVYFIARYVGEASAKAPAPEPGPA